MSAATKQLRRVAQKQSAVARQREFDAEREIAEAKTSSKTSRPLDEQDLALLEIEEQEPSPMFTLRDTLEKNDA